MRPMPARPLHCAVSPSSSISAASSYRHMRDREGIVQVFFDPDRADALKRLLSCVMSSAFR